MRWLTIKLNNGLQALQTKCGNNKWKQFYIACTIEAKTCKRDQKDMFCRVMTLGKSVRNPNHKKTTVDVQVLWTLNRACTLDCMASISCGFSNSIGVAPGEFGQLYTIKKWKNSSNPSDANVCAFKTMRVSDLRPASQIIIESQDVTSGTSAVKTHGKLQKSMEQKQMKHTLNLPSIQVMSIQNGL